MMSLYLLSEYDLCCINYFKAMKAHTLALYLRFLFRL